MQDIMWIFKKNKQSGECEESYEGDVWMTRLHMFLIFAIVLVIIVLLSLANATRIENALRVVVEEAMRRPDSTSAGIPILMYHHLVEDLSGFEGNEAVVSVDQFREQMRFLAQEGFMTLNAQQLVNYLKGKSVPENTVVITFDDGYESKYIYAYPILKEYGLTAIIHVIVAVTPGEIGGDREGIPKISWDQMERMVDSGVIDIQSHTFDSHYYAKASEEGDTKPKLAAKIWIENENRKETEYEFLMRITEDLQLSEQMIENRLCNDVIAIAYPFGVHNEIIRQVIRDKTGIKLGFTVRRGYVKPGDDPLKLNRINVSPRWTLEDFKKAVKSE